jgi:LysM repeat protein
MAGRSPVRFLAPLALVAVVIALFIVVSSSLDDTKTNTGKGSQSSGQSGAPSKGDGKAKKQRKGRRRYIVKNGDTPTSIAEKTGVSLEEIIRLNPDLDPQTLSPGERIKLRP